jgi:hypothetical protein
MMTFELVGGPHDGLTFEARDDVAEEHSRPHPERLAQN